MTPSAPVWENLDVDGHQPESAAEDELGVRPLGKPFLQDGYTFDLHNLVIAHLPTSCRWILKLIKQYFINPMNARKKSATW